MAMRLIFSNFKSHGSIMLQRLVLSLFVFLTFATQVAIAQPPGIRRWGGNTATNQAQGFRQGDPLVLTWSIAPNQTTLTNGDGSDLISFLDGIYNGGIDEYQPILQSAIGRWAEVSGLTIEFEPNDDGVTFSNRNSAAGRLGVRGDIRFGGRAIDGDFGVLAFAVFPTAGDVTIDTDDSFYSNVRTNSLGLRNVIAHEFGHALGFFTGGHVVSRDTDQLLEPNLTRAFDGPQYHDILSAQRGYGDNLETGLGNDTVGNATQLGSLVDGELLVIGESAHRTGTSALFDAQPTGIEIRPDEVDFISIDDQTDTDVFSFSVPENGTVNILLDTLGETYSAGTQNQNNEIRFDTSRRVNLNLQLLGTDGQTVLGISNSGALGSDEVLFGIPVDAGGTYFVRVSGVNNSDALTLDTQFYGLGLTFEAGALLLGDVNLDGAVNFLDITLFISILSTGDFQEEADINQDGVVDFSDIGPLVVILAGS